MQEVGPFPESGLVNLKELNLYSNDNIKSIDALKGMTKLTFLNLRGPHISNISALEGMENFTNLKTLDLEYMNLKK